MSLGKRKQEFTVDVAPVQSEFSLDYQQDLLLIRAFDKLCNSRNSDIQGVLLIVITTSFTDHYFTCQLTALW